MNKVTNPAKGTTGQAFIEPPTEVDHFYECSACGQSVDKRDLGQVFHHEEVGHKPISADA